MSGQENETQIGGNRKAFQKTLWTQVLKAKDSHSSVRREALEELIQNYWKPIYFYVRKRGKSVENAKDLTQGFFTAFLERDFLQYVKRDRGKFRTFLLTALDHYMADEYKRAVAQKRGGGKKILSLNFAEAETEFSKVQKTEDAADRFFLRRWALKVTGQALQKLRSEFKAAGKSDEYEALKAHLAVGGEAPPSYGEIAKKLGISEGAVKTKVHRARKQYREAIYNEVRAYTETEEEAKQELQDLFQAFLSES